MSEGDMRKEDCQKKKVLMDRFGRRLQTLRMSRKKTQEELSQLVSIARPTLANIEGGRTLPGVENLISICRFFGVPAEALYADDDDEEFSEFVRTLERARSFLNSTEGIPDHVIADVLTLLQSMREAMADR
jgi:transcriptional regulator with XRE-family HTH domain